MKKYRVITLCGSTRFRKEFEEAQKKLTLQGNIVISVGLFGHSGDKEVWEAMDEGAISETKEMLDDMHKEKIDMADEIYVVNPGGYIGSSTWSEICYARMTDKVIRFMEPMSETIIEEHVENEKQLAEKLAFQQYDWYSHAASDYPENTVFNGLVTFTHNGKKIIDPWVPEDAAAPASEGAYMNHGDKRAGYDPFEIYGKKKMARYISSIIMENEKRNQEEGVDITAE